MKLGLCWSIGLYAAMCVWTADKPLLSRIGLLLYMLTVGLRRPIPLAGVAWQLRREVDEGGHPSEIQEMYLVLWTAVTSRAEALQPGVTRAMWEWKSRGQGAGDGGQPEQDSPEPGSDPEQKAETGDHE